MKKVTGIGGFFFKSKDPKMMNQWYRQHLGMDTTDYGTVFGWRHADDPEKKGTTLWTPFKESTDYFVPSEKDFMSISAWRTLKVY